MKFNADVALEKIQEIVSEEPDSEKWLSLLKAEFTEVTKMDESFMMMIEPYICADYSDIDF